MDKDELFVKYLLDKVHEGWDNGLITNTVRSQLLTALLDIQETL